MVISGSARQFGNIPKILNPMMKTLFARSLGTFAAVLHVGIDGSAALATDIHFGSTSRNFSIPLSQTARDLAADGTFDEANAALSIYWRGGASDSSYLHFDLSSLQSAISLGGPVSLNCVVDATWGGSVTGSQVSTANGAWTATVGSPAPGFTAIGSATNPSGTYNTGATASWSIPAATFQSYLGSPSFHGLVISGDSNSNAHFDANATLTGTVLVGEIRVAGGTDWSDASWDEPAKTLRISGGNSVTGGNVSLNAGTTLSLQDDATLGGGSFAGSIANQGTLALATSANQSIGGVISGSGSISKSGTGTLTLGAPNSYSGQTLIHGGTVLAAHSTALGQGGHNGATMTFIGDGATLALQGGISLDEHFHIWGAGAGGLGALRSISGNNALTNNPVAGCGYALRSDTTVAVEADTLTVSGFYEEAGSWGLIKTGAGKLVLQAEQAYNGGTTVTGGALEVQGISGRGRLKGSLSVGEGASVVLTGDGTGLGFQGQIRRVDLNGGSLLSQGAQHIWNIGGGVNLTGGTLSSNGGVSSSSASPIEWGNTALTSHASAVTSTVAGRIHIRRDSAPMLRVDAADGAAATDLEISAALTESAAGCGLVKSGAGTLKLGGAVNLTGCLTVNAGTLDLSAAMLGSGIRLNLFPGALLIPPTSGLPPSAALYLNGEKLAPGSWGAPGSVAAGLAQFESPVISGSTVMTIPDTGISNRERWKSLKYGIFSHYTYAATGNGDANDAANAFNAEQYASDLEQAGVQYVVWTAWHSNTIPMFPSLTMDKYGFAGRYSQRDTVGDMIDAVKARGIRVLLYTHPYQPITGPSERHNDFINELYAEVLARYGSRIDGLWIDENQIYADQDSLVDYKRLMATIKEGNPDLVTMQNGGQLYTVDTGGNETVGSWNFGQSQPTYNYVNPGNGPGMDDMLRSTVLQAAANFEGGGMHWSIDGAPNGGLVETTRAFALGRYLAPIRASVCETTPSNSFPPPYKNGGSITYDTVDWVTTTSLNESKEFIHVLKAPDGDTLVLPGTADGKVFGAATLMASLQTGGGTQQYLGLPMTMLQSPRGIQLTLPAGVSWSSLDTVIQLDVVSKGGAGIVNDTSNAISYSGSSWVYQSHRGAGEFNDDAHIATANGDSFTFTFSGTDVEYIATRAADRGPVEIYIDEVFQTTVDLSTGTPTGSRQTVFRKSGLARGTHTLRAVKAGGARMEVDAFKVTELINDSDPDLAAAFPSTMSLGALSAGYSGQWQPGYGWITPGAGYHPDGAPFSGSPPSGDSFEFSFYGTAATVTVGSQFAWGYFYFMVDGVFQTNVGVANGGALQTFSTGTLPLGNHTIRGIVWKTTTDPFQPGVHGFTVTRPDLWNYQSGRGHGEIGDDVHYTDVNPGAFSFAFTGSGVDVITTRDSDARMAWFGVSGMGRSVGGRRNNYSPTRQVGTSVFSMPNLTAGTYSVSAQHGANTSGLNFSFARLAIDALRVYKGESLSAAPLYWGATGNGGSGTWEIGGTANWNDGGQATAWQDFGGSDYTAVFSGTPGTVNLASNINANRLTFQSAGYTLQGNSLSLTGSGPTLATDANATIASTLHGSSGLTKAGAGTLSVTGPNSYTGATTIAAGTLALNGSYATPSFAIASGAVLDINAATALDLPAVTVSGAGTLRKSGSADLVWGPASAVFALGSGSLIDVQGGTFTGGSHANENWTTNLSDLHVASGAIFKTVEANVRVNRLTGSGTIGTGYNSSGYQNLSIGVDDGSATFDGTIANTDNHPAWPGNLVKLGGGTQTLAGANTYTGSTTIEAGKLVISGSVANSSTVTIAAGAELEISGTLSATAQIINHGTLVLTGNPQMSAAGGIINHGTLINRSKTYTLPGNLNNQGTVLSVPGAPGGVTTTPGGAQVTLNWNAVSGATSYTIKQSAFSVGPFSNVATATTNSQVIAGLVNGSTYHFRVSASNATGEGADSAVVSATPSGLPAPFVTVNIGNVGLAGGASHSAGTYTLQGAGAGITGTADACRFVYQTASGDCDVRVRVTSLTNTGSGAKVGVMIRESLAGNARSAGVWLTPASGIQFTRRTSTGGTTAVSSANGLAAPYWVRLNRSGNTFRAYYSANGTTWTQFGSNRTISMASTTYLGIATASGTTATLCSGVMGPLSASP